ncbi:MAG: PLP-dependent aminotransferase family protein, partial [Moraxellaceae bacterium]
LNFDDGHPDSKIAPIKELARAYRQIFNRKARWQMMGYSNPLGDLDFRTAICQMLNQQRGLHSSPQQLCITRGSQMATYLIAQCLLKPETYVMVEDPGYAAAWQSFSHSGAKLLPIGVDAEGLIIAEVKAHLESGKKISALYTTPHHQYPTTVTLSLQRRLELVELSNTYGFFIIEDDYDNEFHYGYRPVLPISSLSQYQHYVYIGTMSKVIAPALRIGYLATSDATLLSKIAELRKIIDVQGDVIMEQAVLQLIQDGTIRRHLKKATLFYRDKRDKTKLLLDIHLSNKATYQLPDGGLAFWLVPNQAVDWTLLNQKLKLKGIQILDPSSYHFHNSSNGIRLSFGSLALEQIEEGIVAIASLL